MPEPVDFHHVIVRAPATDMFPGWYTHIPPADAFDPATIRITPVHQVRQGDVVVGTAQPHHDHLLNPLDRAQWVSYFCGTPKPQSTDARPYDLHHCWLCTHNYAIRATGWTVDGCTTYQSDTLLLIVPREYA